MKTYSLIGFAILFPAYLIAQFEAFTISPGIIITPLSPNTYIHTYENSNGIIFTAVTEALLVSTPPSDEATRQLISWVRDSLGKEITAYVIDRWHPDAMEGLDVVQEMKIPSYASELTRNIAKNKGLPVPQYGFTALMEIALGQEKVICHYLGPAHTVDGIVVYIPSEDILFGGNEVRSNGGWVGNIADAYLDEWPNTIRKVKAQYGSAHRVIPGHGSFGGPELLDYTQSLYTRSGTDTMEMPQAFKAKEFFSAEGGIIETARKEIVSENSRTLLDAIVLVDKGEQYVRIESPSIEIPGKGSFRSESGRIDILNKEKASNLPETHAYYQRLMLDIRDDEVGMTIILEGFR